MMRRAGCIITIIVIRYFSSATRQTSGLHLLERFGRPQAIGKNRQQASTEQRNKLKKAVEEIMAGGSITISEEEAVEFLETRLSGSAEYGAFTNYINKEIAQIIIGQTMTMDDGSSRSQAETHLKVRADLIKADARLIHDSFNRSVVRWLTEWNYPSAAYPITGRDMEEPLDLDALATREAKIAKMMGRKPTAEYIEETYNLPLDEPEQAQPAPTDPPPPSPALAGPTDSDPKAALTRCELSTGCVLEPDRRDWHYQTATLHERRFK